MMWITIVLLAVIFPNFNATNLERLRNAKLFNANQELCKKLNKTLFDEVVGGVEPGETLYYGKETDSLFTRTFVIPGNFYDLEGHGVDYESKDLVNKKFVFDYGQFGYGVPVLNITTKLPRNSNLSELVPEGIVTNIFPVNYRITAFYSPGYASYYLIEGERCKADFDKKSQKLTNRRCWSTPSFCKGWRGDCILNDDENALCYNLDTLAGKREEKPDEVHYSILIGEMLYWKYITNEPYFFYRWNCTDLKEYVQCIYIDTHDPRPHITLLKTLSGYGG